MNKEPLHLHLQNLISRNVKIMNLIEWFGIYMISTIWLASNTWWWAGCLWVLGAYGATLLLQKLFEMMQERMAVLAVGHIFLCGVVLIIQGTLGPMLTAMKVWGIDVLVVSLIMIAVSFGNEIQNWKRNFLFIPYDTKGLLAIAPVILYVYGSYTKKQLFVLLSLVMGVSLIILHVICTYLQGTENFLQRNRELDNCPDEHIYYRNNQRMVFWVLGILALGIVAAFCQFDFIFAWIVKIVVRVIDAILAFFAMLFTRLMELLSQMGVGISEEDLENITWSYSTEMTTAKRILNVILAVLSLAAIFYFLGSSVVKYFRKQEQTAVKMIIDGKNDFTDTVEKLPQQSPKRSDEPKTNRDKVRFSFWKWVRKKNKKTVSYSLSAEELTVQGSENLPDPNYIVSYNKARYSNNEVSGQDVKMWKDIM